MNPASSASLVLPALTLWQREMVRFLRQRDRVVGALLTPVVFWLLLGLGLGRSFHAPGLASDHGYLEYFFAGTLLMILLFTAIFSTISVIEDRREGFLQGVLVAPVAPGGLVLGKILGGATLALGQGLVFVLLAPTVHLHLGLAAAGWLTAMMFLIAFGLTGLGFIVAWPLDSTQGFHAIMNLFLLPLWFLSGALFPPSGAPAWLQWVMKCNPLSYGLAALRQGLYWDQPPTAEWLPTRTVTLLVNAGFAVAMLAVASIMARRTTRGDLL